MAVERARRWPPRQRIHLTPEGEAARASYQEAVRLGREKNLAAAELDAALNDWAAKLGLKTSDGVLLDELGQKPLSVNDLARAVETCGHRAPEVKAAVDRLYGCGLVQPPPQEQPAPATPNSTWRY